MAAYTMSAEPLPRGRPAQRAIANGAAMGLQQPLQHQNLQDMASLTRGYYQANALSAMRCRPPYISFTPWH